MSDFPDFSYEGGDGSSEKQAVLIRGELSHQQGIQVEHAWVRHMRPGAEILSQELVSGEGGYYDVLTLQAASGQKERVWFNITEFFLRAAQRWAGENPTPEPDDEDDELA